MRIITWNCNGQLGHKLEALLALSPDVAIIQECEKELTIPVGFTFAWAGVLPAKGLGVLARDPLMHAREYDFKWTFFLPLGMV